MISVSRFLVTAVVATGMLSVVGGTAYAQTTTFANFQERFSSANNFAKSGNQFISSTNGTTETAIPIFFTFGVANGYEGNTNFGNPILGTLLLSATFTGNVASGSGGLATQQLTSFTADFEANAAGADGSTNLLTISTSTGTFSGDGGSGGEQSSTNGSDTVVFSSAALNFTNTSARNFGLSLTSINPSFSGTTAFANNNIPNFTASGSGSFASNPPPISTALGTAPEPGSLVMLGTGFLTMTGLVVRRRFRK